MSESDEININSLHYTVLREVENDTILEIDPNFYRNLADFIGNLSKQKFDGIEDKIKDTLVEMATELISLLIHIRLDKILNTGNFDIGHLLDEEKFILDLQEGKQRKIEMVISATINGRSKFLESLSQNHKTKKITVRFLDNVNSIVGVDFETYGPFKIDDIATVPYENALALITKNIAERVCWKD